MSGFAESSLRAMSGFIRDSVYSERYSGKRGMLQKCDVRVKIVILLMLVALSVYVHSIRSLVILQIISLCLAASSRINLTSYLIRVWAFVPLFTGVVALPAIFGFVTPGTAIASFSFLGEEVSITREGIFAAFILLMRVSSAVSFAVLIPLTSRWTDVTEALGSMGLPSVFVLILTMTYRYMFTLINSAQNMLLSRKSRPAGRIGYTKRWRLGASLLGALFLKSYSMNERIYLSMISRGFEGTEKRLKRDAPPLGDIAILAFFIFLVPVLLYFDAVGWQIWL